MKTVRRPVRRKQKKLPVGKIAIGCGVGILGLALLAGSGSSKKDAAAPTAAPAAVVTEYVAPVTQIPVTVAPATVPPATPIPATQAPATKAPTAAPTEIPTLKKGSKGEDVKALQQRLIDLGYLSGKADGDYGSKTAQAVKDFQLIHEMTEDGIAGPEVLERVFGRWCYMNSEVWKTKSGKVFHTTPNCSGMKSPVSLTLVEALRKGLEPCQHCN